MRYDYHVHSNYSDGRPMAFMLRAASEAGLAGIGFADHCNVTPTADAERHRTEMGFNLDLTHERRRDAIERLDDQSDLAVFDAIEVDYNPDYEAEIGSFLDETAFDYAIGSVHDLDRTNVNIQSYFADKPEAERRELVDRYFEKLVALIESELFEIAAHPDLVERNAHLRGFAKRDHYEQVADAFDKSRTIPEINAGSIGNDYGEFHPAPEFLDVLRERGIDLTVGTDSHRPESIDPRKEALEAELDDRGIDPIPIVD
jgi:histidinol-phosphatase (PHP family)